jgi:hypothetical protein
VLEKSKIFGFLRFTGAIMAVISSDWKQYQQRDAHRLAASVVRDAVIRFNPPCNDRRPYYRLHTFAGLVVPGGPTMYQKALHEELAEVSNGTL